MDLKDIVAISAVRTPMGKFGGTLRKIPAFDLGAVAIKEAVKRASINPEQVDDVILGSCRQAGNGPNPARTASVKGGIPTSVPVATINMACPSGMKALAYATQSIRLGESNMVLIGGFDSMSTIPYLLKGTRWDGFKMGNKVLEDGWSDSIDPLIGQGMGNTAENLYDKYKIFREEQDEFAVQSHQKASAAQKSGWFDEDDDREALKDIKYNCLISGYDPERNLFGVYDEESGIFINDDNGQASNIKWGIGWKPATEQ